MDVEDGTKVWCGGRRVPHLRQSGDRGGVVRTEGALGCDSGANRQDSSCSTLLLKRFLPQRRESICATPLKDWRVSFVSLGGWYDEPLDLDAVRHHWAKRFRSL